jgi:hypothetical protein
MFDVTTYFYREHRIDLHPYAGGFKAFIYPPGGICAGYDGGPIVVGPDGTEAVQKKRILQESRRFVDRQIGKRPR